MCRETRILMGMPITVEIVDCGQDRIVDAVFAYFAAVENRFSLFRRDSEITALNQGRIKISDASPDMREDWRLPPAPSARHTAISKSAGLTARSIPLASSRAGPSAMPQR